MKKPKKFKSAEQKRQYEEQQQSWNKLKDKWSNATLKSTVQASAPKKAKKTKVIIDEVVAKRVKEARKAKSKKDTVKGAVALKRSAMDPRSLAEESPEVAAQTKAKSESLMPMYNKGPAQYVTEGIDVKTIGSKSRRP
jgi:hypothetical protein